MKFAVIRVVNGNFSIASEHSDIQSAKVKFHDLCKTYWNAKDVVTATICIMDEMLIPVEGYKEYISHEVIETEEVE